MRASIALTSRLALARSGAGDDVEGEQPPGGEGAAVLPGVAVVLRQDVPFDPDHPLLADARRVRAVIVAMDMIVLVRMLAVRAIAVVMIMRMAMRPLAIAMVVHVLVDMSLSAAVDARRPCLFP